MRNMQLLSSKHRIGVAAAACMERTPSPGAPERLVAAAMDALNDMGNIVAHPSFSHPDSLTEDTITAYALALVRLRECASAAGFERLANACDALAVTVSRLIEDRRCTCRNQCASLTRFVVHAEAMIRMSTSGMRRQALTIPGIRNASDGGGGCAMPTQRYRTPQAVPKRACF